MPRLGLISILLCAMLSLAACEDSANTPTQLAIAGKVVLTNSAPLPVGSRLHIILEDVSRTDIAAQTLAELEQDAMLPLNFTLAFDPTLIDPKRRYNLRAKIFSANGALLWISNSSHPLPSTHQNILIEVVQIGANATTHQTYQCETQRIVVSITNDSTNLTIDGKSFAVEKVPSASGTHYQSTQAEFWSKDETAMLKVADQPSISCVVHKANQ